MKPRPQLSLQGGWPKPGRAIIFLLILNVACYVLELIGLRAGLPVDEYGFLSPKRVFEDGWAWQVVSSTVLHSPKGVGHLLFNMVLLWMFGSSLESFWGSRRLSLAYVACALSGGAFTLIVALLSRTALLSWLVPEFWNSIHVGASGAVVGLTLAWGFVFADQDMAFLLLGRMNGKVFAMITVGVELLVALSFDETSSTSHFGGMLAALVLVTGVWRPSRWADLFRRRKLKRDRQRIERELQLIQGGKKDEPPN